MTIDKFVMESAGVVDVRPRIGQLRTDNTLAEVTATGFLNSIPIELSQPISNRDTLMVTYIDPDINQSVSFPMLVGILDSGKISLFQQIPQSVLWVQTGNSAPNKMLTLDENEEIDGTPWENILAAAEQARVTPAFIQTVSTTPGSGECNVVIQVCDEDGNPLGDNFALLIYTSNSAGIISAPVDSYVYTTGSLLTITEGALALINTDGSGQMGITINADPGIYYLAIQLPNGKIGVTSGLVVN